MRSIRSKIILMVTLLVFSVCAATVAICTASFSDAYIKELYKSNQASVDQLMQRTDTMVISIQKSLKILLWDSVTTRFVKNGATYSNNTSSENSIVSMNRQWGWFDKQFPLFEGMALYEQSGISYSYKFHTLTTDSLRIYNEIPKEWYSAPVTNRHDVPFHWAGIQDTTPFNIKLRDDFPKEALIVAQPLLNNKNTQTVGVSLAFFNKELFFNLYKNSLYENTRYAIFDNNMTPVVYCDTNLLDDLNPLFQSQLFSSQSSGYTVQTTSKGKEIISYTHSQDTGWTVCQITSLDNLTNRVKLIIIYVSIFIFILIVIYTIIVICWSNRFSLAITKVSSAMTEFEKGNFNVQLNTTRKDEIGVIYHGFNSMALSISKLLDDIIKQERHKKLAEIRALYYQIKPHFLYNTLASIRMLAIREKNNDIANMLLVLNRLLRNTINVRDHFIDLKEELSNLNDYISIQQIRYNNRLTVNFDVPQNLLSKKVPNMILQPLVENAIEHAFPTQLYNFDETCLITIEAEQFDYLTIKITDNGIGMTQAQIHNILANIKEDNDDLNHFEHIGIYNIHERLQMLYGQTAGITILSEKNKYTTLTIQIPCKEDR